MAEEQAQEQPKTEEQQKQAEEGKKMAEQVTQELVMVKLPEREQEIAVRDYGDLGMYLDPVQFEQGQRAAKLLASSRLVPDHYKGSIGDCFVALDLSLRLGMGVFMVMQKTYVVHGRIGFEAQLLIAIVNSRGPFTGPIEYERVGAPGADAYGITAYATSRKTGKRHEATVTVGDAKKLGWWDKKDSLWPKMTEQMLHYRSATFLARRYCPEVLMGFNSVDELRDGTVIEAEYTERAQAPAQAAIAEPQKAAPPASKTKAILDALGGAGNVRK